MSWVTGCVLLAQGLPGLARRIGGAPWSFLELVVFKTATDDLEGENQADQQSSSEGT